MCCFSRRRRLSLPGFPRRGQVERHTVDGKDRTLLVHRKGATRAFPPHHPLIPVDYQFTGQPVIVGGTMGTCSYVLTGTQKGMDETFGSTCHGAGRAKSRNQARYERIADFRRRVGIERGELRGVPFCVGHKRGGGGMR